MMRDLISSIYGVIYSLRHSHFSHVIYNVILLGTVK